MEPFFLRNDNWPKLSYGPPSTVREGQAPVFKVASRQRLGG